MKVAIVEFSGRWAALAVIATVFVAGTATTIWGQAPAPAPVKTRPLAEGVLTVIPPAPQEEELFSGPRPLVELPTAIPSLEYEPNYEAKSATVFERAQNSTLRRTIWNLEFAFKPLRMIAVDVPRPDGRLERKLIWYMVYRVKNNGGHWKPKAVIEETADGGQHTVYSKEPTNEVEVFGRNSTSLRFFPQFVLRSMESDQEYLDKVIPSALEPIRRREFPGIDQQLYDSLTISEVPIELSDETHDRSVWGVVTFEDIDPTIDYFSIFVKGLTNAYRYEDPPGAFKAGDAPGTGRKLLHKTLQLNFWRPGDTVNQKEEEIRFGVRLDSDPAEQERILKMYGLTERLDYLWVYQ